MNLTAGTALHNGKYVLDTQLGKGVFESTYQATNTQSGQTVVLKTIGENLRHHPDFHQFKLQLLKLVQRLSYCKHPNLVQVIDCFEEAGRPYLVMEYIPGQTLAELVQSQVLSEAKAVEYIRQIGDALNVLHQAGLLHRDVKPQNIILRQDTDTVVLCEFGISCDFTPGVRQTHANLLSAGYAPLEQYSLEGRCTPATDIYALAATFYYLLTGRPPLPAPVRNSVALANQRVSAPQSERGGRVALGQEEHRLSLPDWQQGTLNISPAIKQAVWHGLEIVDRRRIQTVEAWLSLLPTYNTIRTHGSALAQNLVTQPRATTETPTRQDLAHNSSKYAPIQSKTPQPQKHEKGLTSHFEQSQGLATALTENIGASPVLDRLKSSVSTKLLNMPKTGLPLGALLMTGAIAASAGIGFGFALRIHGSNQPGSQFWNRQQDFPRKDFPLSSQGPIVSDPRLRSPFSEKHSLEFSK